MQALSSALHARNMYLMVDVVANHYAWAGTSGSVDYPRLIPFNEPKYFHPYCPITGEDYLSDQRAVEQVSRLLSSGLVQKLTNEIVLAR